MFKKRAAFLPVLFFVIVVACGVNEGRLDEAQATLSELESKGVPLEQLSRARVYLHQARESNRRNQPGEAKQAYSSLLEHLEKAQRFYDEKVSTLGPTIQKNRTKATEVREELTGMQVRKIDSILAVVDSFKTIDWLLQANNIAQELVERIPELKEDEEKGAQLRKDIPGRWEFSQRTISPVHREVDATEEKIFNFFRDGRVEYIQKKKGQSAQTLKEDWEYRSYGNYDVGGDTVFLFIDRFAAVRQNFDKMSISGDNFQDTVWKRDSHETYDSTITDGSQDLFIVRDVLEEDFKRARRF